MKKILTLALLTAAVIVLTQGNAQAGKLFNKCHGCVTFCPAYYNAFSPPCLGIKGKHCCCIPFPGFPTQAPAPAPCCDAPIGDCCADGACHGQLPDAGLAPAPGAPMPSQALPAPISTPETPTNTQSNYQPMPQGPTQASYNPNRAPAAYSGHSLSVYPAAAAYGYGAYPGYNYGYGQPASVPSYWYGNR
jgi:hypothetical protein